jgi:hypothetical protein
MKNLLEHIVFLIPYYPYASSRVKRLQRKAGQGIIGKTEKETQP